VSDSQKKVKPSLESLLKDSQILTGKDLLNKAKAKELELEQFNKSVEFEERNRKNKGTNTSSWIRAATHLGLPQIDD
jgi:hypothetical protein